MKKLITLTAAALVAATFAAPAQAQSYRVTNSGSCSVASVWKLKAKADNGRIEVEFEVDTPTTGQAWGVVLRNDGRVVHRGTYTTQAPSDSFTVERRIRNTAGADRIKADAVNLVTGETCTGAVRYAR